MMMYLFKIWLLYFPFCFYSEVNSGGMISGEYDDLVFAYNPNKTFVTGYYESATGADEKTGEPLFSCIFYFDGKFTNGKAQINTYYPLDKDSDMIVGSLSGNENEIFIQLQEEHGGCWNVHHFADEPAVFKLSEKQNWIEVKYITEDKTYFYSDKKEESIQKLYIIKGDIIFVDKIDGNWLHCTFRGKKTIEGWIKAKSTNEL